MRKVSVTGEIVYPYPLDWLLFGPCLPKLFDLYLVGAVPAAYDKMTAHARLHGRNARLGRDLNRVVAVLALHLVLAGVNVVAEKNRLARALQVAAI
jgi:hypothetical protein